MNKFTSYDTNALRMAVKSFYSYQDMRIRLSNKLKLKKDGTSQTLPEDQKYIIRDEDKRVFEDLLEDSLKKEKILEKWIKERVKEFKIHDWLESINGCGTMMSAIIISSYDIEHADTVSKLWSFTGLAPGKDKLVKGEKSPFNKWLRSKMCGVLARGFLLQKDKCPYTKIYYDTKTRLENEEGWKDKTPKHRHNASIRKMIKEFLKDLYVQWRTVEGLPVRKSYQEEKLGHTHGSWTAEG